MDFLIDRREFWYQTKPRQKQESTNETRENKVQPSGWDTVMTRVVKKKRTAFGKSNTLRNKSNTLNSIKNKSNTLNW